MEHFEYTFSARTIREAATEIHERRRKHELPDSTTVEQVGEALRFWLEEELDHFAQTLASCASDEVYGHDTDDFFRKVATITERDAEDAADRANLAEVAA